MRELSAEPHGEPEETGAPPGVARAADASRPATGAAAAPRGVAAGADARHGVTAAVLAPLLAGEPARPRLTWYGAGRTELSTASLANWSAKVAGLLTDELGAGSGDVVTVRAAASWQVPPIVLGAWWAGLSITEADDPAAVAAFVDEGDDGAADEVFVVSGHPLGAPCTDVQAHQRDFSTSVLPQADRFAPRAPLSPDSAAVLLDSVTGRHTTVSVAAVLHRTGGLAREMGPRARVVSTASGLATVMTTLLAVLRCDGSMVQLEPGDTAARAAAIAVDERASLATGSRVPDLPFLSVGDSWI